MCSHAMGGLSLGLLISMTTLPVAGAGHLRVPPSPAAADTRAATAHADAAGDVAARAAAPPVEELLVTGTRKVTPWQAPRAVTVITAEDIARSPSTSLVDLLAREANVTLRSFFGNDKSAGVDIRGQGDTFVSNVLVLVDGVRLNAPDLSGADFSSLPLDQIDRIEVVRGANAVRYGNGAVGGVINIRTRRPQGRWRVTGGVSAGSFDSYRARAALGASHRGVDVDVLASQQASDGFRDNGYFDARNGALAIRWSGLPWLSSAFHAELHEDDYGLPGPIPREEFLRSDRARRQTRAPSDAGQTRDRRYRAHVHADTGPLGTFDGHAAWRSRDNPYVIGFTPLLPRAQQQARIEAVTRSFEGTQTVPFSLLGRSHDLVVGYVHESGDYVRRENSVGLLDRSRGLHGRFGSDAAFVSTHWSLPYDLGLELGYRQDLFSTVRREEALRRVCDIALIDTVVETTVFVEIFPGFSVPVVLPLTLTLPVETNCRGVSQVTPGQDEDWRNHAVEAGLRWAPVSWFAAYVSYHRSFRNPNIDELTLATTDLAPQRGVHWETGLRLRHAGWLEAAVSAFRQTVEDEIFFGFDPVASRQLNRNIEGGTARHGVEIELKARLGSRFSAWANAGYTDARLRDTDQFVPLVPRLSCTLGADWSLREDLVLSATGMHVGRRADGNDTGADGLPALPGYEVMDLKLRWKRRHVEISAGVANVLDAVYTTAGYSGLVYPMPPRSYQLELSLTL